MLWWVEPALLGLPLSFSTNRPVLHFLANKK